MVKEHEICTDVVKLDSHVLVEFVNNLTKDYDLLKELYDNLTAYKNNEMDDDDIEDFFADVQFKSAQTFYRLSKLFICEYHPVNVYFSRTAGYFADLVKKCDEVSSRYFSPSPEETEYLLDLTYKTLAGVCFLLGCDYHCYDTVNLANAGKEADFDSVIYEHVSQTTIVPAERAAAALALAQDVFNTSKIFRIQFDVFDACPEKGEQFAAILGPDIGAIDETLLTMEMVDDLLSGKISVEQLLTQCAYTETPEGSEGTTQPSKIEV